MPPITVRGSAIVTWGPPWTLTLTSVDGLTLDADGEEHTLRVSLVHSITLAPIPNQQIRLQTSPVGRVGSLALKWTDAQGRCTFQISNEVDENVEYLAAVSSAGSVDDSLTIDWEGGGLFIGVDFAFGGPFGKDDQLDGAIQVRYVNPSDCSPTGDIPDGTDVTVNPGGFVGQVTGGVAPITIPGPGVAGPVTYTCTIDAPGTQSPGCSSGFDANGVGIVDNHTIVGWA